MQKMQWAALPLAMAAGFGLAGCGTPRAPQPPSLNLPEQVADLAAIRAGNQVSLTWTMPKRNTDKLLLKDDVAVAVRVCHKQGAGACVAAGAELAFAPGAQGAFTDTLPAALAAGPPRQLSYFVEIRNRSGRSAGLSNATGQESPAQAVRLHRKLLTPPPAKPHEGLLAPQTEPVNQKLLVEAGASSGRALDKEIRFGQSYEYRAQRVARVTVEGQTLELDGELSAPVRIEASDVFPPEAPTDLAAVATASEDGAENAIDLSWQPVADADLGGYAVYRREGEAVWQRISAAEPLVPPAFHDTQIQPGHTYRYAVSAIGQNGHESARSAETQETVPNP
jgi:hypothetical protein